MTSPPTGIRSWLLSSVLATSIPSTSTIDFVYIWCFFLARGLDCCTDTFMASPYVQMVHTVDLLNPNMHQQPVHRHWLQFFEVISSFLSKIITTVSLTITERMTLAQQLTTHQIMKQSRTDRTMEMVVGRWQAWNNWSQCPIYTYIWMWFMYKKEYMVQNIVHTYSNSNKWNWQERGDECSFLYYTINK